MQTEDTQNRTRHQPIERYIGGSVTLAYAVNKHSVPLGLLKIASEKKPYGGKRRRFQQTRRSLCIWAGLDKRSVENADNGPTSGGEAKESAQNARKMAVWQWLVWFRNNATTISGARYWPRNAKCRKCTSLATVSFSLAGIQLTNQCHRNKPALRKC